MITLQALHYFIIIRKTTPSLFKVWNLGMILYTAMSIALITFIITY